ncbi:MAG TPA: 16S rRNA (guanine(966)-N(2))-methyltransferase RsmD [Pyrinomonadaceae bacterium]|nr:16S rRNA (guanine(966)-N(2))-methyltransferase RsmD [Pyrinomonadaceae bacterium]
MRIIAGAYKGRTLKSLPSMQVRPTSDRLRETLFNVIAPHIMDARFLDLCAGTGAVGIEALSRGATRTTFVDRSRKVCTLIEANVALCRITEEQAEIYNSEVTDFLRQAVSWKMTPWDIVFYDPPYKDDPTPVLEFFGTHQTQLLSDEGIIIVEHHHKLELPVVIGKLERTRVLKQGDSSLSFFAGVTT